MSDRTLVKAKNYLVDGKVLVLIAGKVEAIFAVQGSDPKPYTVQAYRMAWQCSCPAQVECAHIIACKMIYQLPDSKPKLYDSDELDSLFVKLDPQVENEYLT